MIAMRAMSPNARGSLYMVIGSLGYVVNDALVRETTENGPGVYQVLCIRSIGLSLVFAAAGIARGEHTTRAHIGPQMLVRVAAEVGAAALFFAALVRIEFANAQAIMQIVPFAVTLAAAIFIGERVGIGQYVTILIGFGGVLIVVRPATEGFTAWSLLVLVSAAILVLREFATRGVDVAVPATSIAFLSAAGLAVLTGLISLAEGWRPIDGESALLIGLAMGSLFLGNLFSIQTVRVGDLSVSAPFRYSGLLGAVVLGLVFFSEVPDRYTTIGSVIIVLSGVAAVRQERRHGRETDRVGRRRWPAGWRRSGQGW